MEKHDLTLNRATKIVKSHLSWVAMLALTTLFSGCSSSLDDLAGSDNRPNVSITSSVYNISKEEAVDIAGKVLKKNTTRSRMSDFPTFEYVVNEKQTRGASIADTLAYVLNYPDDAGFVIVATDRRVYPVLGFSNVGKFSFENDNAKTNFIDNIGVYVEENVSDSLYSVSERDFDGCYIVEPMVQISLGQRGPWNKYVIKEYPDCPVGCVAVATALVMSHSKDQFAYHNSIYHLKSIITAIDEGQKASIAEVTKEIAVGDSLTQPTYTYEQAVDSMAKLLYWIGKDVNMDYSPSASSASSFDAYQLCKSLDFPIPSGYATFDINEITQYLKDNHIVYLRGADINGKGGHAWVSDACYFCVDYNDRSQILDTYIHCDWGWGGSCNGYYSGSVFEASGYKFKPGNYFAIKRDDGNDNETEWQMSGQK